MPQLRGQSAIEFITSYSYVILIVAVVLAIMFLYFSIPKTVIPFQCSFYSGFSCTDAAFVINTIVGGGQLIIVGEDTQAGIINVSSFNAFVLFHNSTSGYCIPNQATRGQYVYCVANFKFTPNITNVYFGTFQAHANYCTSGTGNLSLLYCPANRDYVFTGSVRVQPSKTATPLNAIINSSSFTVFYVPINLTNSQPVGAQAPFQQELSFNAPAYQKYEANDLGNIRFYYANKEITSWCELNCNSLSPYNTIMWVRLPFGIQPFSNTTIDMQFLANTVEYDATYAGEAPNASSAYGRYDNGQNVFDFYDNFAGSSFDSKWIFANTASGSGSVANGLRLLCGGGTCSKNKGYATVTANSSFPSSLVNFVVETEMDWFGSGTTNSPLIRVNMLSLPNITNWDYGYYGNAGGDLYIYWLGAYTNVRVATAPSRYRYNVLDQQTFMTNGYFVWNAISYPGYNSIYTNSITVGGTGNIRPTYTAGGWIAGGSAATSQLNIGWVRVRAYPPAGQMPVATYGNVLRMT